MVTIVAVLTVQRNGGEEPKASQQFYSGTMLATNAGALGVFDVQSEPRSPIGVVTVLTDIGDAVEPAVGVKEP